MISGVIKTHAAGQLWIIHKAGEFILAVQLLKLFQCVANPGM